MIVKGEVKGHVGNISKVSALVPKGVNVGDLIDDLRKYYGWGNIRVVS